MPDLSSRSALADIPAPDGLSIGLREIPERGMIDLRGEPDDEQFFSAVHGVIGADLPRAPRTSVSWGEVKLLWLSSDQWLILCPRAKTAGLMAELAAALAGRHAAITDVGDMRAILRLEGEGVREVLLKGCSLDLLSPDYPPGTVRRARFAEVAALIHIVDAATIDLYVFRSYARYAWDYLAATARSSATLRLFGAQATPPV